LDNSKFKGTIPIELTFLKLLKFLYIGNNMLSGTIPSGIGELSSLIECDMNDNQFSGTIPSGFNNLYRMDLSNNKLKGPLPKIISKNLRVLSVHDNQLSGHISLDINVMKTLKVFQIHNNTFSGNPFNTFLNAESLKVFDISTNAFTGTIPDAIFSKLASLNTFAIGSNCLTGKISDNICDLSSLETLILTSMGSGPSCVDYLWDNTPFDNIFNGFRSTHYIDGTLPSCLFNMPSLNQLYAGGNRVIGEFPTTISGNLKKISLHDNSIHGVLPTALGENNNITLLDLSNNRLVGDLNAFQSSNNKNLDLSLSINDLSGDIPKSLHSLKSINILAGNVFGCSRDRSEIPVHDLFRESYECGSTIFNESLIFVIVTLIIILMIIYYIFRRHHYIINEFTLCMDVADERRRICGDDTLQVKSIYRYNYQLFNGMWLVCKMCSFMIVFLILYLSLGGSTTRLLENSYGWITTSAYLSGLTSTILVFTVGTLFICGVLYMMTEDYKYYESQKANIVKIEIDLNDNFTFKIKCLALLRLFCMGFIICGPLLAGNVLYLSLLLSSNSTHLEETLFTIFFAGFKLLWSNIIPNWLWENEWLMFDVPRELHEQFLPRYGCILTSKTNFIFTLNSVASFLIPISVQLFNDPACFYNIFIKEPPSIVSFSYESCKLYDDKTGDCKSSNEDIFFEEKKTLISSTIESTAPFVYNYTCANAVLKIYAPVYVLMYTFALIYTFMCFLLICWDVKKMKDAVVEDDVDLLAGRGTVNSRRSSVKKMNEYQEEMLFPKGSTVLAKSEVIKKWVRGTIIECHVNERRRTSYDVDFGFRKLTSIQKNMYSTDLRLITKSEFSKQPLFVQFIRNFTPLKHLVCTVNERFERYDYKRGAFRSKSSGWVSNGTPNRLGSVLIMMTFGMYVPLLGFVLFAYNILHIGLSRLIVGKFLVKELSVIEMNRKRNDNETRRSTKSRHSSYVKLIDVQGKRLALMENEIRDVDVPWGSRAALEEFEKQCIELPSSIFASTRYVYTIICSATFAFVINDIYNSEIGTQEASVTVPFLAFIFPILFLVLLFIYDHYGNESDNDISGNRSTSTSTSRSGSGSGNKEKTEDIEIPKSNIAFTNRPSTVENVVNPMFDEKNDNL